MVEAAGIKGHKLVGLQSLGASKSLQHWNLPDEQNQAKKALKAGEVDVFVMSPISFPDEGVENYVKLGLEHNPNMRFIVQLSWGGGDIDNQDFPKGAFDNVDKEKTPEQLKSLYERNIKEGKPKRTKSTRNTARARRSSPWFQAHKRCWPCEQRLPTRTGPA
jgi:DNA-binding NtrC family response regulator